MSTEISSQTFKCNFTSKLQVKFQVKIDLPPVDVFWRGEFAWEDFHLKFQADEKEHVEAGHHQLQLESLKSFRFQLKRQVKFQLKLQLELQIELFAASFDAAAVELWLHLLDFWRPWTWLWQFLFLVRPPGCNV